MIGRFSPRSVNKIAGYASADASFFPIAPENARQLRMYAH